MRRQQSEWLLQTFGLPEQTQPVQDFSCALQRTILMHGRMYIADEHLCFFSNVFGVKTHLLLHFSEIVSFSKGMHSLINPTINVRTATDEHQFASFIWRDTPFNLLLDAWTALHNQLWRERARTTGCLRRSAEEEDEPVYFKDRYSEGVIAETMGLPGVSKQQDVYLTYMKDEVLTDEFFDFMQLKTLDGVMALIDMGYAYAQREDERGGFAALAKASTRREENP